MMDCALFLVGAIQWGRYTKIYTGVPPLGTYLPTGPSQSYLSLTLPPVVPLATTADNGKRNPLPYGCQMGGGGGAWENFATVPSSGSIDSPRSNKAPHLLTLPTIVPVGTTATHGNWYHLPGGIWLRMLLLWFFSRGLPSGAVAAPGADTYTPPPSGVRCGATTPCQTAPSAWVAPDGGGPFEEIWVVLGPK